MGGVRLVFGVAVALALVGLGLVSQVAGAAGAGSAVLPVPLSVQSASLTQDGQQLVWQVQLAQPFSPGALRRDRRSLCLLIEPAGSGAAAGEVCVAGPRRGQRSPQLLFMPLGPALSGPEPARVLDAVVMRSSSSELTASFLPSGAGLGYRPLRWQVVSAVAGGGCPASGCAARYPAVPALLALHTPRLVGCVRTGSDFVFHGPRKVREVALTFDDGPWYEPSAWAFVRLLAREHAPATFFEVGEHIPIYDPHGAIERQMLADGDMIGDHTWSHPDLAALPVSAQRREITAGAAAIRKATGGFQPCLFRMPYGIPDPPLVALARSMGFTTIQWDVDPRDWALPGVSAIVDNVLAGAHNGAIIEEHFGGGPRYETLDALPAEIRGLRAKGYRLVTLTQLLGYKLVYR